MQIDSSDYNKTTKQNRWTIDGKPMATNTTDSKQNKARNTTDGEQGITRWTASATTGQQATAWHDGRQSNTPNMTDRRGTSNHVLVRLLDKKKLCDASLRLMRPDLCFIWAVLRFIKENSDYRGNFIIGVSKKSSVNRLDRFSYKSSVYRGNFYRVGNVLRKKFGITGYSD